MDDDPHSVGHPGTQQRRPAAYRRRIEEGAVDLDAGPGPRDVPLHGLLHLVGGEEGRPRQLLLGQDRELSRVPRRDQLVGRNHLGMALQVVEHGPGLAVRAEMLAQVLDVGDDDEVVLGPAERDVQQAAGLGGEAGSGVEDARVLSGTDGGVEDDDRTLAALEPVNGVDQPLIVLSEPVLQASLQRLDLRAVGRDDRQPVGRPLPRPDPGTPPLATGEHPLVLEAADELVDDRLVHGVGPVVRARDALLGGVDEDHGDIDQRVGRDPAAVTASGGEGRIGVGNGVDESADRLTHAVLGVQRHQAWVLAYGTVLAHQTGRMERVTGGPVPGMCALVLRGLPIAVSLGDRGQLSEVACHDDPLARQAGCQPGRGQIHHARLVDHHDVHPVEQLARLNRLGHRGPHHPAPGPYGLLDAGELPVELLDALLQVSGLAHQRRVRREAFESGPKAREAPTGRADPGAQFLCLLPGGRSDVLRGEGGLGGAGEFVPQGGELSLLPPGEEALRLPGFGDGQAQPGRLGLRPQGVPFRDPGRVSSVLAGFPVVGETLLQLPDLVVQGDTGARPLQGLPRGPCLLAQVCRDPPNDPVRGDVVSVPLAQ